MEASSRLSGDDPRRAADFLEEASLRMVEGRYDAVVVITDVPVVSRKNRVVPGLASTIGRVMVLSTRKQQASPRGEPRYDLDSEPVPQREDLDEGTISEMAFHLSSAARNPRQALLPVLRSRAPLLPLHLPRLATTALVPTFILVFTAEIWDAGFHMGGSAVAVFALFSILASAVYLSA